VTPDVSAVIVTYNSRAVVASCVDAIRAHSNGIFCEIVVSDNASDDATADFVAATYPDVALVRRARNDGLSAAINDGVAASSGRNVFVLNPDARVTPGAIATLLQYLDEHPDIGVVGPKLLDDDGTLQLSCRAFPGYATAIFNRYSLLTRLLPGNRYSRDYLMRDFDHATVRDVDWVSGAACMLPRRVFDAVRGWDAGYFVFNEDVDLCRRVHDAGYRVVYVPDAVVYHAIGVSKSASPKLIIERHKSMWRYYRKHVRGNAAQNVVTAGAIGARCAVLLAASGVRRTFGRR
jgi:GT2 family glycosyltransferase